ncbi:MAG: ABC transporter permease [Actinobacteria bacterium]|nr:ABC transporter permease [Actinomycetota bacterium]
MLKYFVNRLLFMIPLIFGLSALLFVYMRVLPGDPVAGILGPEATPELRAQFTTLFGLDKPILEQYLIWLADLTRGDFGISYTSQQDITPLLIDRIPATLQLLLGGFFVSLAIGLPIGFLAGRRRGSLFDNIFSTLALMGLSMPIFWIGTLFIMYIGVAWGILPPEGYVPFSENPKESLRLTILPSLTLGLVLAPYLARLTRAATIEVQQEPFMYQSQAKGLKNRTITFRYSARNVLPQILVVLGMQLGGLLGGQVIVEQLFNWPGVGRLLIQGALQRDYPVVQAVILIVSILFVLINLSVEMLHAVLDRRIRLH